MKVKPWQIAVIVIGLLVGIASAMYQLLSPSGPKLSESMLLIDVETGEVFQASTKGTGIMLPARRPDTGKIALLRLRKDDDGKYYVTGRDLSLIEFLDKDVTVKAINAETGDVVTPPKDFKPYRPKKQ